MSSLSQSSKSTNVRIKIPRLVRLVVRATSAVSQRVATRLATRIFGTTPRRRRLRPSAEALLANGSRTTVRSRGRRVATWSWGSGPRVYFVHGWGGRAAQFETLIRSAIDAGFTAIAFDAPAHGDSPGTSTTVVELSFAISAVVDHYGPAHAVIAHSLGGPATSLAMTRGLPVERAVFLASPANPERFFRSYLDAIGLSSEEIEASVLSFEKRYGLPPNALDVAAHGRRMTVPTLLVHDREDDNVEFSDVREIARGWRDATLLATRGLGHTKILFAPEVTSAVLDHLSRSAGACETPVCDHDATQRWLDGTRRCERCVLNLELMQPSLRPSVALAA